MQLVTKVMARDMDTALYKKVALKVLRAIEQNNIKGIQKYAQTFDPIIEPKYVNLAAQLGHVECLKILVSENWPGVWLGTGLETAVSNHNDECLHVLFDKTSTNGKYRAFHAAIRSKNDEFLNMFIPTIPRNSTNWFIVFEALLENERWDFVDLALGCCNWQNMLQRNQDKPKAGHYQTLLEVLDAKRQKTKILDTIDTDSVFPGVSRKM